MEDIIQESFAPIESARHPLHSFSSLSDSNNGSWHEIQELDPRHANQLNQPHLQIPYAAETNSYHHHLHHNQTALQPHQHHHHHQHPLYPPPTYPYFHPASASAAASASGSGLGPVSVSSSAAIPSSAPAPVSVSGSAFGDPTPSSFSSPAYSSPSGSPYHPYPVRQRQPNRFPLFLAQSASAAPINVDPIGSGSGAHTPSTLPPSFNSLAGISIGSGSAVSSVPIAPVPPTRQSEMEVLASPQTEYMYTGGGPNHYGHGSVGSGSGGGSHYGAAGVGIHRRRPSLIPATTWQQYAVRTPYGYGGANNLSNGHGHGHLHGQGAGSAGTGPSTMTESTYDTYGGVDDTPSSAGGHYTSGHTTPVWSHPHSHPHAHAGQQGAGTPYYHPPPPPYGRPMQPPLLLGTGSSMSNMSSGMMIDTPTASHPPHQPPSNGSHAMGALTSPVDAFGSAPMSYIRPAVMTPTNTMSNNGHIRTVSELEASYEQMDHTQHIQHQHVQVGGDQHGQQNTGYPQSTHMGIYANEHERGGPFTAQRFDTSIPQTIPPIPASPPTLAQPSHPTDHSSRPVLTTLAQGSESNTNGVQPANPGGPSGLLPNTNSDMMAAQSAPAPDQALGTVGGISVNSVIPVTPISHLGHAASIAAGAGAVGANDGQMPIDDSGNHHNSERISTNTLAGVTDGSAAASTSCANHMGEPSQDAVNTNNNDQGGEAASNRLTGKVNNVENDDIARTAARRDGVAEPILASRSIAAVHGDSLNGPGSDHPIQIRHHDEEPPSNSDSVAVATLSGPTALGSGVPEGQEGRTRYGRYEHFEGSANSMDHRANDTATTTDKVNSSIVNSGLPPTFKAAQSDHRLCASEPGPLYQSASDSYSSNNNATTATATTTTSTTTTIATTNNSTAPTNTAAFTTSPSTEHHPLQSPQTPSHPSSNMQAVQSMPYQTGSHGGQVPSAYPYHHHDPSYSSTTIPQASNFNPHLSASALRPEWRRSSYPEYPESQPQNGFPYSRGPQATSTPMASSTSSATATVTASGAPVRHSIDEARPGRSMSPSPLGHHRRSLPNISSTEAGAPTLASGHYTPGGRLIPAAFNSGTPSHRSGSSASSTPPSVAVTAPVAQYSFEPTSSPHNHFEPTYPFQAPSGVYGQGAGHRSGNEPVFYPSYSNMGYHQAAGPAHFDGRIRHSSTSPAPPMITGGKRARDDEWDMNGAERAQRRRLSHTPSGSMLGSDGGYATANGSPLLHPSSEMGVIRMAGYAPPSLKEMGIRNVIAEPFHSRFGGMDLMMRRPAEIGHEDLPGAQGGPETSYSFISLPGNTVRKRPRRKFEEITRNYVCSWPGCSKAYGTLNHLNAHVTMQKHGNKRVPAEFKEMRKLWRKQKREQQQQQAMYHQQDRNGLMGGVNGDMYEDDGDNGDEDYSEGQ